MFGCAALERGQRVAVSNSVVTNPSSFVALRNLNQVNRNLDTTQNRVSTGLKVTGALDDASNFAIAQGIRGEVRALGAITQGLRAAQGVVKVAVAAATAVSSILIEMKEKTVTARNEGLTDQQRQIVHNDYIEYFNQLQDIAINQGEFNGFNIIRNGSADFDVLTDVNGGSYTIRAQQIEGINLQFGLAGALDLTSVATAEVADSVVDTAQGLVGEALGSLGADARALELQIQFIEQISDATEEGLGNIVDADLARESAKLTSTQVQQQLSAQTLGIANQRPQTLLGLFG